MNGHSSGYLEYASKGKSDYAFLVVTITYILSILSVKNDTRRIVLIVRRCCQEKIAKTCGEKVDQAIQSTC